MKIKKESTPLTVRKFHDFTITQILREINFGDSRSAKSAILTHLHVGALIFDIYEFCTFKSQINKIHIPKKTKTAVLEILGAPKLISRQI